jgi:hypothetical protein
MVCTWGYDLLYPCVIIHWNTEYMHIYMSLYVFKMVVGVVGGINGHNYPNNPNMLGYNLHMVCRLAYPESSSKKLVCIFVSPLS